MNMVIVTPTLLLFSHSVMADSLQPQGLQHTRLPWPSLSPWVYPNSCPLSQWCHPAISSSVIPFSSCPQSFPAAGSFPISWLFASSGQSIGASVSVLPMNIHSWFPLGLTGLISLLSERLSKVFSSTAVHKHRFFGAQPFLLSSSHIHTWLLEQSWEARCVGISSYEGLPLPLPLLASGQTIGRENSPTFIRKLD